MSPVDPDQFAQIPFITCPPTDGRAFIAVPFFDDQTGEWHLYIEVRPGKLGRLAGGAPVLGTYLGRRPADPDRDYEFFLGTFITQHLSFPSVTKRYMALQTTIHHLAACLEKLHRFSSSPNTDIGATLLVESELSHLTILARRFYDLLQKVAKDAGALAKDVKDPTRQLFDNLPDSFSDVVLYGDTLRTAEEISKKWSLPTSIAQFYAAEGEQFQRIRSIRVAIEHHGKSPGVIFELPEGMAVLADQPPWSSLPIWNEATIKNGHLGSVRAIFGFLVSDVLELASRFVRGYWSCIGTPPAIADGFLCYLRNPFSHHLVALPRMLEQPWKTT